MTVAGAERATYGCDYAWCRSTFPNLTEHWADGVVEIADASEIDRIHCYAFVTDNGNDYPDEITLGVDGRHASLNAALTVDEATRLRDLLDTAIANRAEIRG